jgi:hypothetical protein
LLGICPLPSGLWLNNSWFIGYMEMFRGLQSVQTVGNIFLALQEPFLMHTFVCNEWTVDTIGCDIYSREYQGLRVNWVMAKS